MRKALIIMKQDSLQEALLRELGRDFDVLTCGRAEDVPAHFRPDVLVLDLFLPGMDGLTFLRQRRDELPPVIVVLSMLTSQIVLDTLEQLGVTAVIRKPCTVEAVLSAMRNCV